MQEAEAFGLLHASLARGLPEGVAIGLALLREAAGGRVAVVHLRGERRARRAALAKLVPEFVEESGAPARNGVQERLRGTRRVPAEAAAARGLGARLLELEAAWLGPAGSVLLAEVRDGHLAVRGLTPSGASEAALLATVRAAGPRAGLFEPGQVAARVRPFRFGGAEIDPLWRLKPTELEAARAAFALGYYENPRRCTMEDIARALGITKSAVYHRIHGLEQKAVRRLVHQHGAELAAPPQPLVQLAVAPAPAPAPVAEADGPGARAP